MTYYLYIIYKVIKSTNNDGFNENYLKFLELQENRKKEYFSEYIKKSNDDYYIILNKPNHKFEDISEVTEPTPDDIKPPKNLRIFVPSNKKLHRLFIILCLKNFFNPSNEL